MSTSMEDLGHEKPLAAKVEALAGYGLAVADIACVLAIEVDVLKVTYAHELESSALRCRWRT
ncbi:MAG: hypothetical protein H0T56_04390 [Pseudaminobacter sp.]|nr:hypothetical protein [Pseudaminobacter sp.]